MEPNDESAVPALVSEKVRYYVERRSRILSLVFGGLLTLVAADFARSAVTDVGGVPIPASVLLAQVFMALLFGLLAAYVGGGAIEGTTADADVLTFGRPLRRGHSLRWVDIATIEARKVTSNDGIHQFIQIKTMDCKTFQLPAPTSWSEGESPGFAESAATLQSLWTAATGRGPADSNR